MPTLSHLANSSAQRIITAQKRATNNRGKKKKEKKKKSRVVGNYLESKRSRKEKNKTRKRKRKRKREKMPDIPRAVPCRHRLAPACLSRYFLVP